MKFSGCIGASGRIGLVMSMSLILLLTADRSVFGYTPTDPVVTKMVSQGIAYLDKLEDKDFGGGDPFSTIAGEAILIGYAHHKCRHDPDSPAVKRGLKFAKSVVSSLSKGGGRKEQKRTYVMAICVLLFAEVNADGYRSELQTLQQHLLDFQSANGAFCYPDDDPSKNGDI